MGLNLQFNLIKNLVKNFDSYQIRCHLIRGYFMKIEGKSYVGTETEENKFEFVLEDIIRSRRIVTADCYEGDNYVKTFKFEISSKAVKTNNDDDFFC